MAQVLRISPPAESPFSSRPLSRSSSQTSLLVNKQQCSRPSSSPSSYVKDQSLYEGKYSTSITSSAPPSPRLPTNDISRQPSYTSTPASSLSLQDSYCDSGSDDGVQFPSYDDDSSSEDSETTPPASSSSLTPRQSPTAPESDSSDVEPQHERVSTLQSAGDDSSVERQPSRHVDYLSHEWREEDIWSSWRHIVCKRKTLDNWQRLENASWRTWAKSKNQLRTVSPDSLNWMKDHDVTWLYGPLQQQPNSFSSRSHASPPYQPEMDPSKKSCLKKRSLSEAMLLRSVSNSTLVRQAVDSLVSRGTRQEWNPRMGERAMSDLMSSRPTPSFFLPDTPSSIAPSSSSTSGPRTPCERPCHKRHIHFSDKVEQCIAINKDGDDVEGHEASEDFNAVCDDEDSSDEDIIMMKAENGKERKLSSRQGTPRSSFSEETPNNNRTIAMLPSTTLKYRGDTPELPEDKNKEAGFWVTTKSGLFQSSSQETLKPYKPSSNFLLDDEEDDMGWQPSSSSSSNAGSDKGKTAFPKGGLPMHSTDDEDEEMETRGLRRTPSGMFMPYDGDDDEPGNYSMLGKVIDTVNTARDIAHVIWNVGCRR